MEIATNQTALQSGTADWNYALSKDADAVEVKVLNQNGTLVYEENLGGQSGGSYNFSFAQDEGLIPVAEGDVLTISINAKEENGADIAAETVTNVTVDSVETGSSGSIVLRAGGLFFGVDDILKISQSSADQESDTTEPDDNSTSSS